MNRWTIGGAILLFLLLGLVYSQCASGPNDHKVKTNQSQMEKKNAKPEEAAPEAPNTVTSTHFWVMTIGGGIILLVWAFVVSHRAAPAGTPFAARAAAMTWPPVWAFALFLGLPVFHWLFWAIAPNVWSGWVSSQAFWPMNFAIVLMVYFASHPGRASTYASYALGALVVLAVVIGFFNGAGAVIGTPGETKPTFVAQAETPTIAPGSTPPSQPASNGDPNEGVTKFTLKEGEKKMFSVPQGYRWRLLEPIPTSGWTTDNGKRDDLGNRVQVFEIVPPAKEVTLAVEIKRCGTPQACAW